ncbi:DNA (cytosine-5-)-methyltransferase [Bacillus toyonensis]|uniref:DNA (cytosine-5-)-methyltransferase n=1 Tax=Bacillus toyonensis TaxID=155322 RepID=UPI00027BEA62|nr:DNA (cytosine-5-)-methyltransferase [Bacillus toyonensis]EJV41766.1 DNA (cytosine-5-)-methyltransferase [Bacillus toyonensis]
MDELKVLEAFAGIGTTRMALNRVLPCNHVGVIEWDKTKNKAYEVCHGKTNVWKDIRDVNSSEIPDHDLFTYSFPCTDLSKEGKGEGFEGKNSSLLFECEKIISEKLPNYLLCENVPQLFDKKHEEGFHKWLMILKKLGYMSFCFKLKGCDYGVPQNRNRAFIVSFLGSGDFSVPEKKPFVSIKDYLGEDYIYELGILDDKGLLFYDRNSKLHVFEAVKAGATEVNQWDTVNLSFPTSKTRRGRVGRQMAQTLLKSPQMGIFTGKYLREIDGVTALKLMGIDDEYIIRLFDNHFSDSQMKQMAGDAIVVDVLEAIFREMFKERLK